MFGRSEAGWPGGEYPEVLVSPSPAIAPVAANDLGAGRADPIGQQGLTTRSGIDKAPQAGRRAEQILCKRRVPVLGRQTSKLLI